MNRRKNILVLAGLSLFVAVVFAVTRSDKEGIKSIDMTTAMSGSSENIPYFKESEHVTKKILTEETSEYKITYEYPQLKGLESKEVQEALNASFAPNPKQIKGSFLEARADQARWEGELFQSFNNTTYDIGYLSPELLSIKITKSEYLGYEAHDHQNALTATYDLKTGKQLQLTDVVQDMDQLVRLVSAELNIRGDGFPNSYRPEELTAKELDKFVLTDQGLVIVFDPYEVAPFGIGYVEVLIPYNLLEDVLIPHLS